METIKIINPETIVSIKMGVGFYTRLTKLAENLLINKSSEEIQKIYEEISNDKTQGESEILSVILILIKEFDAEAEKNNCIEEITSEEYAKRMN